MAGSYVVDASLALSWLLPGEGTEASLALRDRVSEDPAAELMVPPGFWYEIAHVLWVAVVRRDRMSRATAEDALHSLQAFGLDTWVADPLMCLSLSIEHDLAVYDTAYLSVAVTRGATLWTLDQGLAKAAHRMEVPVEPLTS